MKGIILSSFFCFFVFFSIGCSNDLIVKKPKNYIERDKMEKVLHDIIVLDAIKNNSYNEFEINYVDAGDIIFKNNGIDSVTFVDNMHYYSSNPEVFEMMIKNILDKIRVEDSLRVKNLKDIE